MIALDTNVIVRYLVEDDPRQSERAARLVNDALESKELIFVSDAVFCELVWVLQSAYKISRSEIARLLESLARTAQLVLEDRDLLSRALGRFRAGRGDFADYIIQARAAKAGAPTLVTFDKVLLREEGFRSP